MELYNRLVQASHLDRAGKEQLQAQLQRNHDVCTTHVGSTQILCHSIQLTHNVPIRQKPYRCYPAKLLEMKEHLDEMLEAGVIVPSTSPYAAPVVLVPKKNQPKSRFCVDYRKLNAETLTDAYTIPNIQEILESLAG